MGLPCGEVSLNLDHVVSRELPPTYPSFDGSVPHVVGVRSEEEMGWVEAVPHIAAMAYAEVASWLETEIYLSG